MSIYIKGMKMPKAGQIVLVEIDENGDVFAAYDGGRTKLTQHKAVPVPPHGRLIDADALEHIIAQFSLNWEYGQGVSDCWDALLAAPTVIEAEGDEV